MIKHLITTYKYTHGYQPSVKPKTMYLGKSNLIRTRIYDLNIL